MRLVSHVVDREERVGIVAGNGIVDAGEVLEMGRSIPMLNLIQGGNDLVDRLRSADLGGRRVRPLDQVTLGPPVPNPAKLIAIGLNYADHATEGKLAVPAEPLIFAKFPSAIVGPGVAIEWDRALTDAVDYEAELGVVIGRSARHVSERNALDYVYGYTCVNDVTARDLQERDGQWVRAKSLDTFCPMGPWLVTADEIPDPQALGISCTVSGQRRQDASTADMLFGVADLISRLSVAFTLEPGDIIATGTPPGVGWFSDPPQLLADGDEVVVSVEGIGDLRNPVAARGDRQ